MAEEEEGRHSLGVVEEEEGGHSLGVAEEEEEEEGHSLGVGLEEEGPFQVEVVGVEAVQTLVEVEAEKSPVLAEEEEVVEAGGQGRHHLVRAEVVAEVEAHLR